MDKSGQSWLLAGISLVMLSGWVWMWALPVLSRVGYYCLNQGLYKVQGKFQRFFSESKHWVSLWQALKRGILDSFSLLLSPKDTEGQDPTSPYIWVGCLYQLLFRSKLLPFFIKELVSFSLWFLTMWFMGAMRDSFSAQNNSFFREKIVEPSLYLEKRYHFREIIHYFSFGTWTLNLKALQLLFGLGVYFPGFGVLQIPNAISCLYITTGFPRNKIVFSWLLKSLTSLEKRGNEAPAKW